MHARAIIGFGAALCAAAVLAPASPAEAPARATAAVADGSIGAFGTTTAKSGDSTRRAADVATRDLTVRSGEAGARATRTTARATAAARSVSALGGMVTAYGVRRTASAGQGGPTYEGRVDGLRIGDRAYGEVTTPRSIPLPDGSGRVVVNVGTTGLRVLRSDGTDLRVAVVTARLHAAKPTPTPTPTPEATATPDAGERKAKKKEEKKEEKKAKRKPRRKLAPGRYVFPVLGDASFSDEYGAPRQIGDHEGNDVFGPFGTPVVAVADGVVEKVGTLPISGNRLWLRTAAGDTFFYAHLATFAPAAVSGRRVRAGTVLGYVGNTGDAEPTPPHVHFEIHPGDRGPINPYRTLLRWQAASPAASADAAGRPGALVEVRDFIAGE